MKKETGRNKQMIKRLQKSVDHFKDSPETRINVTVKDLGDLLRVAEAAKDFIFGEVDLEDDKRQYNKLVETLKKLEENPPKS